MTLTFAAWHVLFICVRKVQKKLPGRKTAEGVTKFPCSECGKFYSSRSNLSQHMQLHTGQFKHYCQQCRKGFNAPSHFRDHMRTHQGLKYFCDICSKPFSTASGYRNHHITMHTTGSFWAPNLESATNFIKTLHILQENCWSAKGASFVLVRSFFEASLFLSVKIVKKQWLLPLLSFCISHSGSRMLQALNNREHSSEQNEWTRFCAWQDSWLYSKGTEKFNLETACVLVWRVCFDEHAACAGAGAVFLWDSQKWAHNAHAGALCVAYSRERKHKQI